MRSKTLAVYAAIMVAGLVAGYGLHALLAPAATQLGGQDIATVILQVYKNGQLVYEKKGDPALENLLYYLAELLDYDDGSALDNSIAPTRVDGTQKWTDAYGTWSYLLLPGNTRPTSSTQDNYIATPKHGVIVFGEDTTFRRTDYTMVTVHAIQFIDEFDIVSNDTGIYLTVGATYNNPATATTNVTISAVGLGVNTQPIQSNPGAGYTWLLFKDVLASPVVLQPGDSIHVRYTISFP